MIDGLEGDRIAVLAKVHHSIIDGISGSELASVLFDLEPSPPDPPLPTSLACWSSCLTRRVCCSKGSVTSSRTPWRITRLAGQSIRQGLTFLGFQRQSSSPAAPFQAPRTSFNTELTPHRRFAFASVPLDEVKSIRWAFDVKVNDVILALVSGALRRYLESRGELPDEPADRAGAGVAPQR